MSFNKPIPGGANFGELDWANATDPAMITVTLTYDYAILEF